MKTTALVTQYSDRLRPIIRSTIGLVTGLVGMVDVLSVIIPKLLQLDILLLTLPLDVHEGIS